MIKKTLLFNLAVFAIAGTIFGAEKTDSSKIRFENAFVELKSMMEEKQPPNFERAVFVSENAYWDNKYSFEAFQKNIDNHLSLIKRLVAANDKSSSVDFNVKVNANGNFKVNDMRYTPKEKKELYYKALKNWAVFTYLTDTTFITYSPDSLSFSSIYHFPYTYASNDPFGMKDWSNSQVLNLLTSKEKKGNCFALTGFYKILADRLKTDARICTAPQHIYIQHQDDKGAFYNVELATAGHPGDGMIQTLTYTTNDAIMNGIALRSFNAKESIGLCMVNLAKSYEHKFNTKNDEFILKCAELILKHDSLNLNALLLKQQVLDERVSSYASIKNVKDINNLKKDPLISQTLSSLQEHLSKLYVLGYRQMPLDMQKMILSGFRDENIGLLYADKNLRPFTTVKPKDKKDESYWTLSHGVFQEVFEHKKKETYGHFTFNTETKTIASIDTQNTKGFLIDPVAFAYDFGARMYDARLGIFTSTDPLEAKYPQWSPYSAFSGNPIWHVDIDGREVFLYHAVNHEPSGKTVYKSGEVSQKTDAVLRDMLKTPTGLAFVSQFAKAGQTIAGHTFKESGALVEHDLVITDFSYEESDLNIPTNVAGDIGASYNETKDNLRFDLRLITKGESQESIAETYNHESQLHGDMVEKFTDAFNKGGKAGFEKTKVEENMVNPRGARDHSDLQNKNTKSPAYQKYIKQKNELIKVDPKYKK